MASAGINLFTTPDGSIGVQDAGLELLSRGVRLLLAQFAAQTSKSTTGQPSEVGSDSPDGFHTSTKGIHVKYSDFIPGYLQPETQLALRKEMAKPVSENDESGFVYAYLVEDEASSADRSYLIQFKVGRTVDVQARLNSWKRHCRKKVLTLVGWYPGNIEDERLESVGKNRRFEPGEKTKYCHKLERLVHIELGDLAIHAPYLDTYLFDVARTPAVARMHAKKSKSSLALNILQNASQTCDNCRVAHKEVFTLLRPEDGPYKDHEWEKIVMPVIQKWGRFIRDNW